MDRLLLQGVSLAERLRNRRMRNRLYGGVRGQVNTKEVNTSISVHLLLDLDWCYFIAGGGMSSRSARLPRGRVLRGTVALRG